METISNRDKIYIGKNAGFKTNLLKDIKNAKKSVKIVSPYLTGSYLSELVELSKKGVEVTLITADELREDMYGYSKFRHKDIIKQNKIQNPEAKAMKEKINYILELGLILTLVSFSLYFISPDLLIISGILALALLSGLLYSYSIKDYKYEYSCIFRLKVFDSSSGQKPGSRELIHSKIFVIDENIAFLGSANFTYSGFTTHYETLIKIEDLKAIKDISKEVESLYSSTELLSRSIEEWGKEIYGN